MKQYSQSQVSTNYSHINYHICDMQEQQKDFYYIKASYRKRKDILNIFPCCKVICATMSTPTLTAQTGHTYKKKDHLIISLSTTSSEKKSKL